jgi:hypothetical protein
MKSGTALNLINSGTAVNPMKSGTAVNSIKSGTTVNSMKSGVGPREGCKNFPKLLAPKSSTYQLQLKVKVNQHLHVSKYKPEFQLSSI